MLLLGVGTDLQDRAGRGGARVDGAPRGVAPLQRLCSDGQFLRPLRSGVAGRAWWFH
jgi:hypothetical protein